MPVIEVRHPLIADALARMRDRRTGTAGFRESLRRVSLLLACEASRDFTVKRVRVRTPLATASCEIVANPRVVAVPVLRAGLGMLDGLLELFPDAGVGVIGLKRDERTFEAREYYRSLPPRLGRAHVFLLDPMLATGGSLLAAAGLLLKAGARDLRVLTLVAAREGVRRVERNYPELTVYTAAIDGRLNDRAYIVPGIGDAGDRICGTEG